MQVTAAVQQLPGAADTCMQTKHELIVDIVAVSASSQLPTAGRSIGCVLGLGVQIPYKVATWRYKKAMCSLSLLRHSLRRAPPLYPICQSIYCVVIQHFSLISSFCNPDVADMLYVYAIAVY